MNVPSVFNVTVPPAVVVIVCGAVAGTPVPSAIVITSPSGSVSLLITLLDKGTSINDVNESSVAIGGALPAGLFRSRTSIDTLALSVLPPSSDTVYWKLSLPSKPAAGVYSYVPSGLMTTVPPFMVVMVNSAVAAIPVAGLTTVRSSSGLGSLSLVSTLPETETLVSVVFISSCASGGLSK